MAEGPGTEGQSAARRETALPRKVPGDTNQSMDARVTRLETHMEYVRADLSELKAGQRETTKALMALAAQVEKLPTKSDLWAWKLQWLAIALVGFATIVGGIIGGLGWIKAH